MSRVWGAAALAMAAWLAPAAARAQDGLPCLHPKTQQALPQILGPAFTRGRTHGFEAQAPGFGCSVRYEHPSGMWADVYIYRAGLGVIDDVERDPRLMDQFQGTMNAVEQKWKQQPGAGVRDLQAHYEKRGSRGVEVMVGSAFLEMTGRDALRTHVQLWSGGGAIWKLRATFPAKDLAVSDDAVRALAEALVDLSRGEGSL